MLNHLAARHVDYLLADVSDVIRYTLEMLDYKKPLHAAADR